MPYFIALMTIDPSSDEAWVDYINQLNTSGLLRGGSRLSHVGCKSAQPHNHQTPVSGYLRFEADDIESVLGLLDGNPAYQAGGTIEVLQELSDS